jgi:proline iminopeptidase
MHVEVNGTRLWFDVDGPGLVPNGSEMAARPTVVLVHGGPASYDHSYFKPHFSRMAEVAQTIYLDLRDHGRSAHGDPAEWSLELCADDLRAFCDVLGMARPIVLGHSLGGVVAALYGARHPGHAAGLILQSTLARLDLDRLVGGFRAVAGDEVAELARRSYRGDDVSDEEWEPVFAAFGPNVPSEEELARRIQNLELAERGTELLLGIDIVEELGRITCPTLVCVGELDPVTSVDTSREIAAGLRPGIGQMEVLDGAGHFPWLDDPDAYWAAIHRFVSAVGIG